MPSAYIVPGDLLLTNPPRCEWHATGIPADPTQSLLIVKWDDVAAENEFESQPAVLHLGAPWEPLPDAAALLLASFQDAGVTTSTGEVLDLPSPDISLADSVSAALKKTGWPLARLVR